MIKLAVEDLHKFDKIWDIENNYVVYLAKDDVWKILNNVLVEYIVAKTSNCFKLSLVNDKNYIYVHLNIVNEYTTNILVSSY